MLLTVNWKKEKPNLKAITLMHMNRTVPTTYSLWYCELSTLKLPISIHNFKYLLENRKITLYPLLMYFWTIYIKLCLQLNKDRLSIEQKLRKWQMATVAKVQLVRNILRQGLAKGQLCITVTNTVWHVALCSDFHWFTIREYKRSPLFCRAVYLKSFIIKRKPDNKNNN